MSLAPQKNPEIKFSHLCIRWIDFESIMLNEKSGGKGTSGGKHAIEYTGVLL